MQDLGHLENVLAKAAPRFAALNLAICTLVEDFGLVGFETLAVEVPSPPPLPPNNPFTTKKSRRTNTRC